MENKLFIGRLNYATTEEGLKNAFAQAGEVLSASIIMDKFTGRSKGFGFVEMSTEEEANAAIQMLDNKELDGRTIAVSIARPKEDRPRTFDRPRSNFGGGYRN
ncbi:MAG TPA: RNA-binding protein [Candidatus Gracilibacteria bacterium]|nr:RNA-binding protein [Candidatus Gracilibacteria bacterium]